MKILVTGGAGFIGSNLVNSLVKQNHEVTVLDDFSTGYVENLNNINAKIVPGSILDKKILDELPINFDGIIHLAARGSVQRSLDDPLKTFDVNFNGTINILEFARKNNTYLIFSSSSSVYGANPINPRQEELMPLPMSPYAASKLACENAIISYGNSFNLRYTIFRFFNVFGPNQSFNHPYAAVIPNFIYSILKKENPVIFGNGNQSRDFTFINFVTDILGNAIERQFCHATPLNLAAGNQRSLNSIISDFTEILKVEINPLFKDSKKGDVYQSEADVNKLKKFFGNINNRNFKHDLKETYLWYKNKLETN